MHRELRGHFYLSLLALCALFACSGCSFVKVPNGWMLNTGWSLEFHRLPFNAAGEKTCAAGCDTACNATCNSDGANAASETSCPTESVESAATLHKVEGEFSNEGESSAFANLLKRRGRLGVCATCGKLGRFKEPQPAVASTMPVIAKFHPVPTAPVFCPQPNLTRAADFQTPTGNKKPLLSKKIPLPPRPEVIPPPPASAEGVKAERAPRELDVPPEPPDWAFTTPENQPDPMSEAQSLKRSAESSKRR
jgi:hypothetical protein